MEKKALMFGVITASMALMMMMMNMNEMVVDGRRIIISPPSSSSSFKIDKMKRIIWPSFTAMFVLGDSSVDCGENTPFYSFLHHNLSLHPCNSSDSSLLPNLLAKKMGLPFSRPFYSQNGSAEELLRGVNFGSALATIMYSDSPSHQSLTQQLRQAFETIQLLQLELGEKIADNFIKSSLFYLSFGKDDYTSYFLRNLTGSSGTFQYNHRNFTYMLVRQMTNALRNLYGAKVKNIVCMGILPLGCTPRVLYLSNSTVGERNGCHDEVNKLVLEYNTRLEEKIVDLNAELPDASFIFCDVYRATMDFVIHPEVYGFEDVRNACCGTGRYGGMNGCLSPDMACDRASSHVWWDFYNPTQSVYSLLANSAWSGRPLSDICRPLTVQELAASSSAERLEIRK